MTPATTCDDLLASLPSRGFGVLRCPAWQIVALHGAGLVKAQHAGPNVWHVRLTGEGRAYRLRVTSHGATFSP